MGLLDAAAHSEYSLLFKFDIWLTTIERSKNEQLLFCEIYVIRSNPCTV